MENQERKRLIKTTKKNMFFFSDQIYSETSEPPDLFNEIPIIPSLIEMTADNNIYLRKNITTGAYKKRRWQAHFQMKLDESQYKAIRMVLNQNLYQC